MIALKNYSDAQKEIGRHFSLSVLCVMKSEGEMRCTLIFRNLKQQMLLVVEYFSSFHALAVHVDVCGIIHKKGLHDNKAEGARRRKSWSR